MLRNIEGILHPNAPEGHPGLPNPVLPDVDRSHALGPAEPFVAGEQIEAAPDFPHVDVDIARRLGPVQHSDRPPRLRLLADFRRRNSGTVGVEHMADHRHPRPPI